MTLFKSNRERRLWLCVLLVVIAIYSSLGLVGALAGILREKNLLGSLFFISFLMILAAIIGSGLQRLAGKREIWVTVGIIAVYGMMFSRLGSLEERTHLFEYGVVAILIHQAFLERLNQGGRVPVPAVLAVVLTAILGWLDEGIQAHLPNRVYDFVDVGVNFLSALMAVTASVVLRWSRKRIEEGRQKKFRD